jgi:virulence factor
MLKIGVIGLGDIAQKAYLPVIAKKKIEVHLCSRSADKLQDISQQYRFQHTHGNMQSLLDSGIKGAFVHVSTSAHFQIVEQLLQKNIHVFVDKPLTDNLGSSEKLITLAKQSGLLLSVGFNRRFSPAIQNLKEANDINMIVMQKNRDALPGKVRSFVLDDFIHVVDTLLFLFPHTIDQLLVSGKRNGDLVYHITIQLISKTGATAIGIMNRDCGTTEEKIEVFTPHEKKVVYNVTDSVTFKNKNETKVGTSDWESTLYKRGFEQMVDDFLVKLGSGKTYPEDYKDTLHTHQLCETIVERLNSGFKILKSR